MVTILLRCNIVFVLFVLNCFTGQYLDNVPNECRYKKHIRMHKGHESYVFLLLRNAYQGRNTVENKYCI